MDPKLVEELSDILMLPKHQALAKLQEKKRQGELNSEDLQLLLTEFLSPTRIEPDGHKFALHTQLARTRLADDNDPCYYGKGTPPQRYSWSVADRRSEPIRRGSPEWFAAKRQVGGPSTLKSSLVTSSDNSDDEAEAAAPQTKWGRVERGRTSKERCAARLRCALGQPSSLRSSWSVDDSAMIAFEGAERIGSTTVEESIDRAEESMDTVETPVDTVEEPVEKLEESVKNAEEEVNKVEVPVYRVEVPVDMVAKELDPQLDDSGSEDKDREVTRISWATTLRRWRETIMWRC